MLYLYCWMVMTPWEQAIWLYGASEQKVGLGDGWMDTPQTVTTTRAPAVLKIPKGDLEAMTRVTRKQRN